MVGADYFYLLLVFFILSALTVALIYVSQQIQAPLQSLPGYNTSYNPETAGAVTCQQQLIGNMVQNTLCTVNYAPAVSNTYAWPSPLNVTNQILANYNSADTWLVFIFFIVSIAILASVAFLPNVSPMAIALGFLMLVVLAITSMIFSNAINTFFSANILANAVAKLPQIRMLWANITEYEILFSFIYMILIAARSRGGGGTGGSLGRGASIGG